MIINLPPNNTSKNGNIEALTTTNTDQEIIWTNVVQFLNQNDLCSLARCSKHLCKISERKLYNNIHVNKDPIIKSNKWFLDTNATYLFGYRTIYSSLDQDKIDLFLYDKIQRLLEAPKEKLSLIKELYIYNSPFYDQEDGVLILKELLNSLLLIKQLEILKIENKELFQKYHSKVLDDSALLKNFRYIKLTDFNEIEKLNLSADGMPHLETLELDIAKITNEPLTLDIPESQNIRSLIIRNDDGMEILNKLAHTTQASIPNKTLCFPHLISLKFGHTHRNGSRSHSTEPFDLVPILKITPQIDKLENLEIGFTLCDVNETCNCLQIFLHNMAPLLLKLRNLGLIEQASSTLGANHNTKEMWDILISEFIIELPFFGANLIKLSIDHNIPHNGLIEDSVDGNYFRRRRLYENLLPHLSNLRILIVPNFIQSVSCFEIIACDFLWNGCKCASHCNKVLRIYDKYIHNHLYFDNFKKFDYKEISPTVFLAYASSSLSNRLHKNDIDLEMLNNPPSHFFWNFHDGYDNILHYEDCTKCYFDESAFPALCKALSHFVDSYMEYLMHFMPNLKTCCLSGVYYYIENGLVCHNVYDD
ncbi:related to Non-SCF-type F-box protein ROY1 [Saccharomycodes ludwigii]|uniref:Related to Non-SCF-type F-box protein ROY1 n=1 Tax=Saccharomycodes ludwigii TaxID=36035 RepID=A0A376B5Q9_9ASCO|nr:related to Non-SCF-type F-box protein ROY1 [Saccharomycodes ludwigii]